MASLPSAHASQAFGRRSIHFYAAPGQVIGSDPRARADERRLMDSDGEIHAMRLAHARFPLEPGDFASVLRLQAGPKRRSRPVAVVHHERGTWERTQPSASVLLARAGVSRSLNWMLAAALLLAALIAAAYLPVLSFLQELAPTALPAAPGFDVFALALERAPGLTEARLGAFAPEFEAGLARLAPDAARWADLAGYVAACAGLGVAAFAARSWRLVWAPVFVLTAIGGAIGLGGVENAAPYAAGALTAALALFVIAGGVNRVRDTARLDGRIETLAEHLLRHPPEEMVMIRREAAASAGAVAAAASAGPASEHEEPLVFEDDPFVAPEAPEDAQARGAEPANDVEAAPDLLPDAGDERADEPSAAAAERLPEPADAADEDRTPSEPGEPAQASEQETGAPEAAPQTVTAEAETEVDPAADGREAETASEDQPEPAAEAAPASDEAPSTPPEDEQAAALEDAAAPAAPYRDASLEERAMLLPPPPPMPTTIRNTDNAPRRSPTQPMTPTRPLPDNVVPIFSAPPPPREDAELEPER